MKKILALLMCFVTLCSCGGDADSQRDRLVTMEKASVIPVCGEKNYTDVETSHKLNYTVQKAIWISYIDLADMLTGKSAEKFRENISQACENALSIGCNTLYVHVRPFGDAIYDSKLYPASRYITGMAGERSDFDPLDIMIQTAHDKGLSFHAWINPLRCENEECFQNYDDSFLLKKWYDEDNGYLESVEGDSHLWLDPAYDEVRQLIAEGAAELAENYDIDGLHFDDYFYPTTDEDFDAQCFSAQTEFDDLAKWRQNNISLMVGEIYSAVKAVDKDILVGVSPQGNMENNYEYMYADVKKWCSEEGYIDYICPQIYFGYENSVKPYEDTLQQWADICTTDVTLVAGLGAYKIDSESEFSENIGIIGRQINDAVVSYNYAGAAVYGYGSLFGGSDRGVQEQEFIEIAFDNLDTSVK